MHEWFQRLHESLVLLRALDLASLTTQLAVNYLAVGHNLERACATCLPADLAALELSAELRLELVEGRLVASGAAILDINGERHV